MTDIELLIQWLKDLNDQINDEIQDLSPEMLAWQPDPEANNIGVTVWHVARWVDVLATQVLQKKRPADELWHTGGWYEQTGYDPRGIGAGGLGTVTGYTQAEVKAIPRLSSEDLLVYLKQSCAALQNQLLALPVGALYQPAPGLGSKLTTYQWVQAEWQGFFGHVGEIQAIKAMYKRQKNVS